MRDTASPLAACTSTHRSDVLGWAIRRPATPLSSASTVTTPSGPMIRAVVRGILRPFPGRVATRELLVRLSLRDRNRKGLRWVRLGGFGRRADRTARDVPDSELR